MQQLDSEQEIMGDFMVVDLNASSQLQFSSHFPPDLDSPLLTHHKEYNKRPSTNSNNKNKYINNINALRQQSRHPQSARDSFRQTLKFTSDKTDKPQKQEDEGSLKHSNKLAKSRVSAKMSRERKKLYIELLQAKASSLERQVKKSKQQLEIARNEADKITKQSKTISGFTANRYQTLNKLEQIIQRADEEDTDQINCIIDSLRYRIGATGKERVNTLNQHFKQIVFISFPALHRYIMWTATEQKHLFNNETSTSEPWFQQLYDTLGLSEGQRKEIMNRREEFVRQREVLTCLIQSLQGIKRQLQQRSQLLQQQIDSFRNIMLPIQCAKFILFIEKNKYRPQMNIWDKQIYPNNPASSLPTKD